MKIEKICRLCGTSYYVTESQKDRSKFCSDYCFRQSRKKRVNYNCDYCGALFEVVYRKYEEKLQNPDKKLFCSKKCAQDVQKPKWEDITNLFKQKGYILLSEEYISARTKLKYICPKHSEQGNQSITYNNLKQGFGCTYCGDERTAESKRLTFEEASHIFELGDKILLPQEYKNANTPMAYICKFHQDIGVQYMALSNACRQHCPHCHIIKGENKITKYLQLNNIEFEYHKSYDGLCGIGGGKLSYDFYLPNFNMLIEYQGEQHKRPVDAFGGESQFKIQQEHDKRKQEYARAHNIELLEIWYYDFKKIEKILNNKLLIT